MGIQHDRYDYKRQLTVINFFDKDDKQGQIREEKSYKD